MRDYEPLIIDLKKSDPIRSARGSLTLFLLALLMGVVSVTNFLVFSVYKTPLLNTPSTATIPLKMEEDFTKTPTKPESTPTVSAEALKAEFTPQIVQSPESEVLNPKDPKLQTPDPGFSLKPSEEVPAVANKKSAESPPTPKKDKGISPRGSSVDKPSSVRESQLTEPRSSVMEPSEWVRSDKNHTPIPVGFGFITIRTMPEGVAVYLNERLLGTTPLIEFQVPAGRHSLKLAYKDTLPFHQSITVNPLETVSIFQEFEKVGSPDTMVGFQKFGRSGSVLISSSSSRAEVYLNGGYRGQTPLIIDHLPAGTYWLTLRKDGFETVTRPLEVIEGETKEVFVTIKRLGVVYPDQRRLPDPGFPSPRPPGNRRPERPYR